MKEVIASMTPLMPTNRRTRGLDILAYLLALVAFFPAAGLVGMFGVFAYYWQFGPKSSDGYMTGRRFIFEFFWSPLPAYVLSYDCGALFLAGVSYAIVRRRRRQGHKMADAAGRLALFVTSLVILVLFILAAMAIYRFVY
jgi:hypothetical protein